MQHCEFKTSQETCCASVFAVGQHQVIRKTYLVYSNRASVGFFLSFTNQKIVFSGLLID